LTIRVRIHGEAWTAGFERDHAVRLGRGRTSDVRVGNQLVQGRWTVSKAHVEIHWDGGRWRTVNVSDKPGLLSVYEPGYEEVPLEPGRVWAPVRHRWSYAIGRPDHRFHVICATDDHLGPGAIVPGDLVGLDVVDRDGDGIDATDGGGPGLGVGAAGLGQVGPATGTPSGALRASSSGEHDDEPTAGLDTAVALSFTPLERRVLLAYYAGFARLPRPATLEPRAHDDAAHRLGRSRDSTRKAIERINEKIRAAHDAPAIATGRNVSAEIGRWLARSGTLDPDLVPAD
jgi:hypothetical protein